MVFNRVINSDTMSLDVDKKNTDYFIQQLRLVQLYLTDSRQSIDSRRILIDSQTTPSRCNRDAIYK